LQHDITVLGGLVPTIAHGQARSSTSCGRSTSCSPATVIVRYLGQFGEHILTESFTVFDPFETFGGTRDRRAIASVIRRMTFGCSHAPRSPARRRRRAWSPTLGLRTILVTTLEILTLAELQAV
jgi:hypothetical protein